MHFIMCANIKWKLSCLLFMCLHKVFIFGQKLFGIGCWLLTRWKSYFQGQTASQMTDISENNKDRNNEKGRWVTATWKGYSISWQWKLLSNKTDWTIAHRASAAWAHVQYAQVLPTPNTHMIIQKEGSCYLTFNEVGNLHWFWNHLIFMLRCSLIYVLTLPLTSFKKHR